VDLKGPNGYASLFWFAVILSKGVSQFSANGFDLYFGLIVGMSFLSNQAFPSSKKDFEGFNIESRSNRVMVCLRKQYFTIWGTILLAPLYIYLSSIV
jgi:uncharacterized membrane protein